MSQFNSSDLEIDLLTNPDKIQKQGVGGARPVTLRANSVETLSLDGSDGSSVRSRKRPLSQVSESERSGSESGSDDSDSESGSGSGSESGSVNDSEDEDSRSVRSYSSGDDDDHPPNATSSTSYRPSTAASAATRMQSNRPGPSAAPRMSPEEEVAEKRKLLFALYRFQMKNKVQLPTELNMNSSLEQIQLAVDFCRREAKMGQAVKLSKNILVTVCSSLEWLNDKYDPFDIYLKGWSETVKENEDEYDDVFEELYEKYQDKVAVSPEIKLMMMVVGSAAGYHLMHKSTQALSGLAPPQASQAAPTFQAPTFQAPTFQAPTFQAPTFQAPTQAPPPPAAPKSFAPPNFPPRSVTQMGIMTAQGLMPTSSSTMRPPLSVNELLQEVDMEDIMGASRVSSRSPSIALPYESDSVPTVQPSASQPSSVMSVDISSNKRGRGGRGGRGRRKNAVEVNF